jgi:DNA-binding NarL/FixJ family response regulator
VTAGPVTPSAPIRVLVADDHPLIRTGLTALLDGVADLAVVGEAADGDQAVEVAAAVRPDVVLMDLSMPGTDGVAATRRLLATRQDLQVLVLTSFSDRARIEDALDAGATGYLLKDSPPADVVAGIRAAARRESPLDPRVARALLDARAPAPCSLLGPRETDVLRLVARGMANKQIARTLGIRESTVKVHLGNVFRRLGVQDRTSAALWAQANLTPD